MNVASRISRIYVPLAASIPDVVVAEIADAGHASNLDNPGAYTAAIEEFLSTIDRFDAPSSQALGSDGLGT